MFKVLQYVNSTSIARFETTLRKYILDTQFFFISSGDIKLSDIKKIQQIVSFPGTLGSNKISLGS